MTKETPKNTKEPWWWGGPGAPKKLSATEISVVTDSFTACQVIAQKFVDIHLIEFLNKIGIQTETNDRKNLEHVENALGKVIHVILNKGSESLEK